MKVRGRLALIPLRRNRNRLYALDFRNKSIIQLKAPHPNTRIRSMIRLLPATKVLYARMVFTYDGKYAKIVPANYSYTYITAKLLKSMIKRIFYPFITREPKPFKPKRILQNRNVFRNPVFITNTMIYDSQTVPKNALFSSFLLSPHLTLVMT